MDSGQLSSLLDRRVGLFLPQPPLGTMPRSMAMGKSSAQRMHTRVWQCHWRRSHVRLNQAYSRLKSESFSRLLGLLISLFAVSSGWIAPFSWAESAATSPDAREILKRGTIEAGGSVGYWQAWTFPSEEHSANRSAVFIMPRIGMVVTDEVKAGMLSGNVELLVEPFFAQFTHPFSAQAAGGSLVIKYNLLSFGRWMPFWDAGAGMLWTNLAHRIPEQSTQFNFDLETGPGIQYFMTPYSSMTFGVRYSHISNAGLGQHNLGLDAVLPYAGVSWFLPK